MQNSSPYGWLMLAGIAVSAFFWMRLARRDDRLLIVYIAALVGAFLGAKLAYLGAEGWRDYGQPDLWLRLATGKSILGALLGGYASVELAKRWVGYRSVTGDWFAMIAPFGIILGRVGCWLHGCCLGSTCEPAWFTVRDTKGVERWPAVPVEILFNTVMLISFFALRRRGRLIGQHFHVYLIAYGVFRFPHEFLRDTPRIAGILSGYQMISVAMVGFGVWAYRERQRKVKGPASR